jgi:hypothetical protein
MSFPTTAPWAHCLVSAIPDEVRVPAIVPASQPPTLLVLPRGPRKTARSARGTRAQRRLRRTQTFRRRLTAMRLRPRLSPCLGVNRRSSRKLHMDRTRAILTRLSSYFALGRTPAALSANCRSHADSSSPAFLAASVSACFCSTVTRIRTTSSFVTLGDRFLGDFAIDAQRSVFVATLQSPNTC